MAKGIFSPFVIIFAGLLLLAFGGTVKSQLSYDQLFNPETFSSDEEHDSSGRDIPTTINVATSTNVGNGGSHHNPFEIDVITSDVPHRPEQNFFAQHIPYFGNHPFFTTFGQVGGGGGLSSPFDLFNTHKHKEPWWKGPNVCTDRTEDEQNQDTNNKQDTDSNEDSLTQFAGPAAQFFSGFQFSLNSCVEKQHKHVCKQVFNRNGKKKTLTISRQCCHGYGRSREADFTSPCEQLNLKPIIETADEIGAKEFIKSAKTNGLDEKLGTNITVFLPTDVSFTEYSETMFENNLVNLPNNDQSSDDDKSVVTFTTKDLALNHIVDGWVNMDDIENEDLLTTNYLESRIRINIFPQPPSDHQQSNDGGHFRYTANCAPIIKVNQMANNGMVHIIDRVLAPVTLTVMDIIKKRDDMTILRLILEKTNMNEILEGKKPVTIFAPTDKAFQKLDQNLRRTLKEGKGCATNILKNHILDLTFCSVAVVNDAKTTAYNLLGEPMIFERSKPKNNESLNREEASEIADLIGGNLNEILVNGKAKILETDMMGINGVIHIIDTIMTTESALPISSLLDKKNLTIFKSLIDASNLQNELDDLNNVTYFIPTDKAFENSIWKEKLLNEPDQLKDNIELKEFINYHIVEPMTKTCDLSEKLISTKSNSKLRVNLYSTHPLFTNVMNRATVNCARLMHFDDESCGSVLHQVDKILESPKMNLLQSLESNPNYSKFVDLLKLANLTSILEDETTSYTILIPKNDVFEESEEWLKKLTENQDDINDLVQTHIVNDVICCAGIIPTSFPFVRRIDTINNDHLKITRDRRPKIENAAVTKCDIITTNGIIHEINDVIQIRKRNNSNRHHQHHFNQQSQPNFESLGDLIF